ncbi:MAG TPA: polymer-forming cytoskeletal protein [Roseiflexaceae bacterium]|nr:polymer-forming cytoskeletal protein [Roseiflexaceae bacterium]
MFGRRNPDQSPNSNPASGEAETDTDLDLMPDLPPIPSLTPPEPAPEPPPSDPAWHASAPPATPPPWEAPVASAPPPAAPTQASAGTPTTILDIPPVPVLRPATAPTAAPTSGTAGRSKMTSESVIGPDDFFDGRYRSERGVRIQGNARGSIESRQYIFVESGADVEADLSAEDITVAGSFNGKIECRRKLEVTGSGKVRGQVTTALLVVHEGGLIDGELHMQQDAQPSES